MRHNYVDKLLEYVQFKCIGLSVTSYKINQKYTHFICQSRNPRTREKALLYRNHRTREKALLLCDRNIYQG